MAERPLECSQCKKPIKVVYKEISRHKIITTEMCADCPILQEKLHGSFAFSKEIVGETGLCCGRCGTSLDAIKMGNPLGCSECYFIFSDLLVTELLERDKISPKFKIAAENKKQPIHVGRSPEKTFSFTSSSRLIALNEALNEALKKENYEQAAWLRDQIKTLKEKTDERKK